MDDDVNTLTDESSRRKGENGRFGLGHTGFEMVGGHVGRPMWTIWLCRSRALERGVPADTNRGVSSSRVRVDAWAKVSSPWRRSPKPLGAQHLRGGRRWDAPEKEETRNAVHILEQIPSHPFLS